MTPIISIVGKSNSGKTTLIEKLIPEIKKYNLTVGAIKHDAKDHFEFDHEGKDTWRHTRAGAETVVITSATRIGMVSTIPDDLSIESLVERYFSHVDVVLVEGYKHVPLPKIELVNTSDKSARVCAADPNLIAVISDLPMSASAPVYSRNEVDNIAQFILEYLELLERHDK